MSAEPDVLRELQAELAAVTPSPQFAVRVRARIADAPARRKVALWTALACAMSVVALVLVLRFEPDSLTGPPTVETAATPVPGPPLTATIRGTDPAAVPAGREEGRAQRRSVRVTSAPPRPQEATAESDPFLNVVTNQGAVLKELWRHAAERKGAALVAAEHLPVPSVLVDADGLMVVPALVVDPIVVAPIAASSGGQGRIQRVMSPSATGSPR